MKSNIDEKKLEKPETVGAALRSARVNKKMTIEALASAASISMRDLERLEAGDYDHLPAEIYVRSFLERCAKELGIQADPLIELYQKEDVNLKDKKEARLLPATTKSSRFIITPKYIIIAASALGVILLTFYFWYQLSSLLKPPFLVVENPASDLITNEETIAVSGKTQRDSHVFINGREVEVSADSAFKDDFHLEAGTNTVEIKSVNRFGKETVLIRRIIKN